MSDLFQYIKEHVYFETVANEYGIVFKNHKALCPFHSEKTPSFHSYGTHGKCFGCENVADVIELEAHFNDISPLQAAKSLADRYNIDISECIDSSKKNSTTQNKDEAEDKQQTNSQKLINLVLDKGIKLFHDPQKSPYAKVMCGDHYEYYRVNCNDFKLLLSRYYWNEYGKPINQNSLSEALSVIESQGRFDGQEYNLNNRVARDCTGIMYDLGNWKSILISEDGWKVHDFVPPVFKYYSHQKPQVLPLEADSIDIFNLFNFLNIKEEDRLLFLCDLTFSFVPDLPHPILALLGDYGTAKTTAAKVYRDLVDPSTLEVLTVPSSKSELAQLADHHWVLPFDNLHTVQHWFSDALCKIVTGDGYSKRELYTNDDDIIYSFKRKCILTGINQMLSSPDVLSRILIFQLEKITNDDRKEESLFWQEYNREKPQLLGAIFSLISETLTKKDLVNHKSYSRLADFEKWGCAVALALGMKEEDFIKAYRKNIELQNKEAIEASPVAKTLLSFMEYQEQWEGTPSKLYSELKQKAEELLYERDKRFPTNPSWLSRKLNEVKTDLSVYGIEINHIDSSHGNRTITIINNNAQNGAHAALAPEIPL